MNDVLEFIEDFKAHAAPYAPDAIEKIFTSGYCYYFAVILQTAFKRGEIMLAAPYGHIVWRDEDKTCYDISGVYSEHLFEISINALGDGLEDFLHVPGKTKFNNIDDVIRLITQYAPTKELRDKALEIIQN